MANFINNILLNIAGHFIAYSVFTVGICYVILDYLSKHKSNNENSKLQISRILRMIMMIAFFLVVGLLVVALGAE